MNIARVYQIVQYFKNILSFDNLIRGQVRIVNNELLISYIFQVFIDNNI